MRLFQAVLMTVSIGAAGPPRAGADVTFTRDVAPIIFDRCAACHRPGAIGPFSLLGYEDVRQRAVQIAEVTKRRIMPPWKPASPPGEFVDERALSDEQIQTIAAWVDQGTPEGARSDLPPVPDGLSLWKLGTPDLVVSLPQPYVLAADGPDVFRTFVMPISSGVVRHVGAVEFEPGNARAIHHANFGIDRTRSSRREDARDPEPGYGGGMVLGAAYPPGHMLGWTPGQQPRPSPAGMAWRLETGSDLVIQLHMQPTGRAEMVQPRVAFYFTSEAPVRTPVGLRLGSQTIDIPAGEGRYVVTDEYVLPVDVEVLAIQPHAHNLARRMEAEATLPNGTRRPLITITDWDFRWQDVYRYAHPFVLPQGTRVAMQFIYDNSTGNIRNPHVPPRRVVWGQSTSDEMGDLWIQLAPRRADDLAALSADIARKQRATDLAAYGKLLNEDPGNPMRHDAVAVLHLQGGNAAEATRHLRESLRLDAQSAPAHYNLGLALLMQGERGRQEAMAEFTEALRLDPAHAEAHNNLGATLHVSGQYKDAKVHYLEAIALRPDHVDAHSNVGRLLLAAGQGVEAAAHFRAALERRPDHVSALAGLAWALASSVESTERDRQEAVRAGERAAELTARRDPTALDALAAAYATAGRFDRAVGVARSALDLAMSTGLSALAKQIGARLADYEQRLKTQGRAAC